MAVRLLFTAACGFAAAALAAHYALPLEFLPWCAMILLALALPALLMLFDPLTARLTLKSGFLKKTEKEVDVK